MSRRLRGRKRFAILFLPPWPPVVSVTAVTFPGSRLSRSPTCASLCFLMEGKTTECSQKAYFLYHKHSKILSKCLQGILGVALFTFYKASQDWDLVFSWKYSPPIFPYHYQVYAQGYPFHGSHLLPLDLMVVLMGYKEALGLPAGKAGRILLQSKMPLSFPEVFCHLVVFLTKTSIAGICLRGSGGRCEGEAVWEVGRNRGTTKHIHPLST